MSSENNHPAPPESNGDAFSVGTVKAEVGKKYNWDDMVYARFMEWSDGEGNLTADGLAELARRKTEDEDLANWEKERRTRAPSAVEPMSSKVPVLDEGKRKKRPEKTRRSAPTVIAEVDKPQPRVITLLRSLGFKGKFRLEKIGTSQELRLTLFLGKEDEYKILQGTIEVLETKIRKLLGVEKPEGK